MGVIEIREDVKKKVSDMWDTIKDGDLSLANKISAVIDFTANVVEKFKADLSGGDRLETAVQVVNDVVDVKYIPEWLEAKAFRFLFTLAVDLKNKYLGHDWLDKINNPTNSAE